MKCIIIDDEPIARRGMKRLVESHPGLELAAMLDSAEAAIDFLSGNDVDLLFLDIQMPGMTGMELARRLLEKTMVIFTTAYSDFALESYEVDAVDYLMKPIDPMRFSRAVAKAEECASLIAGSSRDMGEARPAPDFIIVKADRRYHRIPYADILYIEGLKDYIIIRLRDRKIVTRMTVKGIGDSLPADKFFRVAKSYIVNLDAVTSFDSTDIFIGDTMIPIGVNYRDALMQRLLQ